jgi:hypothetical protein
VLLLAVSNVLGHGERTDNAKGTPEKGPPGGKAPWTGGWAQGVARCAAWARVRSRRHVADKERDQGHQKDGPAIRPAGAAASTTRKPLGHLGRGEERLEQIICRQLETQFVIGPARSGTAEFTATTALVVICCHNVLDR